MSGLTLGPFSFSAGLLTTFAAMIAVLLIGKRLARGRAGEVETSLWIIIAAALLAGRIVYVFVFAALYAAKPLAVLDFRDGGFNLTAGLCAGLATAALLALRRRDRALALLGGAGAGAGVFGLVALVALAMPAPAVHLPPLTLARLEGGTLAFSSLAGKPVVINLWASWCGPCRREMPVLRQAQLDNPGVTFIFVNQGETPEQIGAYLLEQRIALGNIVLDARPGLAHVLGSKALPATFFFDSQGVLTERRVGELSAATLAERLPRR